MSRKDAGAGIRAHAARVDAAVLARGMSLDRALDLHSVDDPRDRALLRAICYDALRWHYRLQWQVEQLLERPLKRNDAELAALLRVGLVQLQLLRIPDHAAVAATVAAAELLGRHRAKGLVNAVLRRFLRERDVLDARLGADRQAATSHPAWMLELFDRDWPGRVEEIVAANNRPAPMWLRVNAQRVEPGAYLEHLAAAGLDAEPLADRPTAVRLLKPQPTERLPGFEAGLVSVQDAAAQLAATRLAPAPGERILDACAAPGGKAAHMLEHCPAVAELVALDNDPERLSMIVENFARLGLPGRAQLGDASEPSSWWDGRAFDGILLDAPCSALGVIRRHPDIKVLRRARDLAASAARQARLLRALWPLVAPGGRLLYATCSIAKDENEKQIRSFLAETADASLDGPQIGEQILPGEANMDGFYYACLHKR